MGACNHPGIGCAKSCSDTHSCVSRPPARCIRLRKLHVACTACGDVAAKLAASPHMEFNQFIGLSRAVRMLFEQAEQPLDAYWLKQITNAALDARGAGAAAVRRGAASLVFSIHTAVGPLQCTLPARGLCPWLVRLVQCVARIRLAHVVPAAPAQAGWTPTTS